MESGSPLGEFLRAQRELVMPEDVGLPTTGRRRAQGLRREEAASLAGISTDHYLRLEQGHEPRPSDEVLDGLARALRLSDDAIVFLHTLSRTPSAAADERGDTESAPPGLVDLINAWPNQAAYIQGRLMDILASNRLAVALSPLFRPGTNRLRAAFLDPAVRELYRDWDGMLSRTVADLRALIGPNVDDPKLAQLVGELSVRSEEFRTVWATHDVRPETTGLTRLQHPQVGALDLRYQKFAVDDSDGQVLVILHAAPGSDSEGAFRRLAAIAAGSGGDTDRPLAEPVPIESKRRQV